MGRYAVSRGVAGIIIDGAVRDTAGLAKLPIPVYARAVTPNGPGNPGLERSVFRSALADSPFPPAIL